MLVSRCCNSHAGVQERKGNLLFTFPLVNPCQSPCQFVQPRALQTLKQVDLEKRWKDLFFCRPCAKEGAVSCKGDFIPPGVLTCHPSHCFFPKYINSRNCAHWQPLSFPAASLMQTQIKNRVKLIKMRLVLVGSVGLMGAFAPSTHPWWPSCNPSTLF